jgi:chorismate synthase
MNEITIRILERPDEIRLAVDVFTEVWEEQIPHVPEIRATVMSGGYCAAIYVGAELAGAIWSFVGLDERGPFHHSHMAAVRPRYQGRGLGETLKRAQAAWCLARGIDRLRWTFDPLQAGNARFNLERLGAVADTYLEDCYGPLGGLLDLGARFGTPAPSDRLEVTWYLDEKPRFEGREERVTLPTPEPASGAEGTLAAIHTLRARLAPLLNQGGVVVGVAKDDGGYSYRVLVP